MGLFNIFKQNELQKNKSYIKNLLEVALADGQIEKREMEVIISIASKFDVSKEEVLAMKENYRKISFTPPSSYTAKVRLLEDLVKVMIVDNEIDDAEVIICKELAIKLNITPIIIDELIQAMTKSAK